MKHSTFFITLYFIALNRTSIDHNLIIANESPFSFELFLFSVRCLTLIDFHHDFLLTLSPCIFIWKQSEQNPDMIAAKYKSTISTTCAVYMSPFCHWYFIVFNSSGKGGGSLYSTTIISRLTGMLNQFTTNTGKQVRQSYLGVYKYATLQECLCISNHRLWIWVY